jgi:hypothetical protein
MKSFAASSILSRLSLVLLTASIACGQPAQQEENRTEEPVSAAWVFVETMEQDGFDAAMARFAEMRADESGAYQFIEREFLWLTGRRLLWRGRYSEALALLKPAVEIFPDSPDLWFGLGSAYIYAGDRAAAARCLEKALTLDPSRSAMMAPDPEESHVNWMLRHLDELVAAAGIIVESAGRYEPGEPMGIDGPYLARKPPGDTPVMFAPGIVASPVNEFAITIAPDGKEIYFSRSGPVMMVCRRTDAGWTAPAAVSLSGDAPDDEPNFTPDGRSILFNSKRELNGRPQRFIHIVTREGDGWGEARQLFHGMYATATRDGAIYYTEIAGRPDYGVVACRRPTADGYGAFEKVGGGANTDSIDAHPWIAPDESLLLFDSNRDGGGCIYVCFRDADGAWGEAINLCGHLDIPRRSGQSCLSPDGRYLFFSFNGDMYWVSARTVHDLRPR